MRHLALPLLAVPLLVLVPSPAAHAVGSCQGMPATIESSTPGATLTGTEGPDVILVTGSATVDALGGDDTICVAGGSLDAGPGNDHVSVTGQGGQRAELGPGDDTYLSVGQTDLVDLGEGASAGTDHIETRDGNNDEIGSGTAGEPNRDVINTSGNGAVHLVAPAGSAAQLTAVRFLDLVAGDAASYVIDAPSRTISRDGAPVASYDSTTNSYVVTGRRGRVTFHGTDASDSVQVRSAAGFRADLGGGTDSVYLYPGGPRKGRIDGGPGHDWLYAHAKDSAVGDLARHRLSLTSDGRVSTWRVSRFGNLYAAGRRIDLRGSSASESMVAFGCDVTLRGLGGKDWLNVGTFERGWPPARRCPGGERGQHGRLYGGGANDDLVGGDGPDVLIGGPGRDRAGGSGGQDRCEAEETQRCER